VVSKCWLNFIVPYGRELRHFRFIEIPSRDIQPNIISSTHQTTAEDMLSLTLQLRGPGFYILNGHQRWLTSSAVRIDYKAILTSLFEAIDQIVSSAPSAKRIPIDDPKVDTEPTSWIKHMSAAVVQLDERDKYSDEESSPELVRPKTRFGEKKEISAIRAAYTLDSPAAGTESQLSCPIIVRKVSSAIFCLDTGDEIASKSLDSMIIPNTSLGRSQVGGSERLDSRELALDFSYHSTSKDKVDATKGPLLCGSTNALLKSAGSTLHKQHCNPKGNSNRLPLDQSHFHKQPQQIKAIDGASSVDASHHSITKDLTTMAISGSQKRLLQATNSQHGEAGVSDSAGLPEIPHTTSTRLKRPTRKICGGSRPAVEQEREFNGAGSKVEGHQANMPCVVNNGGSPRAKESCVPPKKTAFNPNLTETVSKAKSRHRKVSKNASYGTIGSSRPRRAAAERAKVKMTALKQQRNSQFHSEDSLDCNIREQTDSAALRVNAPKVAPGICEVKLPSGDLIFTGESQHPVPNVINLLKSEDPSTENMQQKDDLEVELEFGPNAAQQNDHWSHNEIKPLRTCCYDGDIATTSNISIDHNEAGISSDNLNKIDSGELSRPVEGMGLSMARKLAKALSGHDITTSKNLEANPNNALANSPFSDAMDDSLNQQTSAFMQKKYKISHQISKFMSCSNKYGRDSCPTILSQDREKRTAYSLGGTSELLEVIQSSSTPASSPGNCGGNTYAPRKAVTIQSNSIYRKDSNVKSKVTPHDRVVLSNSNTRISTCSSDSSCEQNVLTKSVHPAIQKPPLLDRKHNSLKRPIEAAETDDQALATGHCMNSTTKRIRSESSDSNVAPPRKIKTFPLERSKLLPPAIHSRVFLDCESMAKKGSPRSRVGRRKSNVQEVKPVTVNAKKTRDDVPNGSHRMKQVSNGERHEVLVVRDEIESNANNDESEISKLCDKGFVPVIATSLDTPIPLQTARQKADRNWERLHERSSICSPDSVNGISQARYQDSSAVRKANSKVKIDINTGRTAHERGLPTANCFLKMRTISAQSDPLDSNTLVEPDGRWNELQDSLSATYRTAFSMLLEASEVDSTISFSGSISEPVVL
jgi:hypothetical protein